MFRLVNRYVNDLHIHLSCLNLEFDFSLLEKIKTILVFRSAWMNWRQDNNKTIQGFRSAWVNWRQNNSKTFLVITSAWINWRHKIEALALNEDKTTTKQFTFLEALARD